MSESFSKVAVIGLGYIGLPTASMLASRGVEVAGVDVNERVVAKINSGEAHFVEPDLDALVQSVVAAGKLRAATVPEKAQAYIIAVPTPFKDGKEPDFSYIQEAGESIAPFLDKGNLVILESTSPVGSTERLGALLAKARPDLKFPGADGAGEKDIDVYLAYCPERVLPGRIIQELRENDRIVGGMTASCSVRAAALYRIFVNGEILVTDSRTAEMAKLTENAYRDVNIAFANELSLVCDRLGINVWELIRLSNHHPRVEILRPGPGVGGHCIAVDPWFIVHSVPEQARLIRTAREINDSKPGFIVEKIMQAASKLKDPVIACLGLSYKSDVDDLRESPAVLIVKMLADSGAGRILVAEPHLDAIPAQLEGMGVEFVGVEKALEKADVAAILVDHSVFRTMPKSVFKSVEVIDTRGVLS